MSDYNFNLPPPWVFYLVMILASVGGVFLGIEIISFLVNHITIK